MKANFLPLIIFALVTTSAPAHAGFLDDITKKITDASKDISDKIKKHYGWEDTPSTPPNTPPVVKEPPKPPVETAEQALRKRMNSCQKFLGYTYDVNYAKDTQKIATIYLNASLNYFEYLDTKITAQELNERNKCAELALQEGADPDSNGKEKKEDSGLSFESPAPIVRAVRSGNEAAVKLLLEYKANPNAKDDSMGNAVPLLNTAIYSNPSQEIALALIEAGADLSTPHLLWIAAGNAADKVVEQLIISNKIPVNQLSKFTDYSDEEGQTALDTSESNIFALEKYKKKIDSDSQMSLTDKILEANNVLYYHYPLKPQMKVKDVIDPENFMDDLMTRQQNVSNLLKAAGGVCNEKNCGILDFSNDD